MRADAPGAPEGPDAVARDATVGRGPETRPPLPLGLVWLLAVAGALVFVHRARAQGIPSVQGVQDGQRGEAVAVERPRVTRDVATLAAREALLTEQAEESRASVRWRLRALYRLAVAGDDLPGVTRARALEAGARALGRELAEARALGTERAHARTERATLVAAAGDEPEIGAPPAFVAPIGGPVLARFGVWPHRATGLLVSRAGVRLAAVPRQGVRAPAAGAVVAVTAEPGGNAVVLDHGAGWTTIVGGLADVDVAAGAHVDAGQRLGVAAAGPAPVVIFEVWRGRHPVDPSLLVRAATTALATPARLP